jgi:hypothetical protein
MTDLVLVGHTCSSLAFDTTLLTLAGHLYLFLYRSQTLQGLRGPIS